MIKTGIRRPAGRAIMALALLALLGALAGSAMIDRSDSPRPPRHAPPDTAAMTRQCLETPFQCGMVIETSWGAHGDPRGPATLRELKALGVDAIQVVPFAFQPDIESPEIRFRDHTATQTAFIREAHSLGLRVLLKPHIWSHQFRGARWRGNLRMHSEADWKKWFASYTDFILHYARIAEATGVEVMCIGLEYVVATRERPEDWRALIAATRAVYHGPLTYAANLHDELAALSFWDDLDLVGVNVYPSLSAGPDACVDDLVRGFAPTVSALARVAERHSRPVIVTEIGFPATRDATIRPWEWPDDADVIDPGAQSRAYEATFRALWDQPWLRGIYWWKWPIDGRGGGPGDREYTPRHKPAAAVLARYYRNGRRG